jgi:broad specificity phosphatase PhoE
LRVSVLRHGESENNVLGIECTDLVNKDLYGLTPVGVEQIEHIAEQEYD